MKTPLYRLSPEKAQAFTRAILAGGRAHEVLHAALMTCSELVDDLNCTGGLVVSDSGIRAPAADETWTNMGETAVHAAKALELAGLDEALVETEDEVEPEGSE